ncbi:hypothetical protein TNCV_417211 [Trichonephila clavipes]|nr:hypothetical protein TNCV_417211 [Trichonephila clavipes]
MGRGLHLPKNADDLARQLEPIWQEIPQKTIRVLYHFMSRRVAAFIQPKRAQRQRLHAVFCKLGIWSLQIPTGTVLEQSETVLEQSETVLEQSGTVLEQSGTILEQSGTVFLLLRKLTCRPLHLRLKNSEISYLASQSTNHRWENSLPHQYFKINEVGSKYTHITAL